MLAAAAVVLSLVVFRGALGYFFAQDDFTGLARARGLLPPLTGPWRYLSGQLYFDVMTRVAGLQPLAYRIVSLTAHAACVLLVFRLCRRYVSAPAAALGAVFFGTHPSLYTALYSVSGIGEILSAGFALSALLVARSPGQARWLAPPAFAASLLCKESTLLLPLLPLAQAVGPRSRDDRSRRGALAMSLALAAISAVYLIAFLSRDVFGVRVGTDVVAPYAMRLDRTLLDNLLTYLGWTVRIALPAVKSFADSVEPAVYGDGVVLAIIWFLGLGVRDLRRGGWIAGGVLFLLLLLPVLPLAHHTYHYYLYAPLVGAALCAAALADAATRRLSAALPGWAPEVVLAVAGIALAVNGALLVHRVETYPFLDPELRSDATVDRARIAANAVADLEGAALPAHVSLWFWSPVSIERQRAAGADSTHESYWETNVRTAIYDGLAVRLYLPGVRDIRFVRTFEPAGDSVRYAVYLPNGHLRTASPEELAHVLQARRAGGGATP